MDIMAQMATPMFKAMDINHDDRISLKEYTIAMYPLGVSEDQSKIGFQSIDEDGDGYLSQEEFAVAVSHYYFDKEESKYMNCFGQFVESTVSYDE